MTWMIFSQLSSAAGRVFCKGFRTGRQVEVGLLWLPRLRVATRFVRLLRCRPRRRSRLSELTGTYLRKYLNYL